MTTPKATDAMIEAGFKVLWGTQFSDLRDIPAHYKEVCSAIYTAMHAASPNREASEIMREALEDIARLARPQSYARERAEAALSSICKGEQ
jgi:hypothetical protein